MQYVTFSKNLNPRNIEKAFRISVSGCKLAILSDIQPETG